MILNKDYVEDLSLRNWMKLVRYWECVLFGTELRELFILIK